jgi:hypothetical protein
MSTRTEVAKSALTPYEVQQVRRIAAWKSLPPNPLSEMVKMITLPVARAVEPLIPDRIVREAIAKAYDISQVIAGQEDTRHQAGVKDLCDLRNCPLEECDHLARRIAAGARTWAIAEGAATGAGGVFTTLLDVPVLFILALRTILKIGHCYGYPLDHHKGRHFVLGVLIAAISGSLEVKRKRLHQLRELEELLLEETQEDIITEELVAFLFQLEIFEGVPGVGTISGAVLNWSFIERVSLTARRVFQERWLHDNGKVDVIEPAAVHDRVLATGWSGALGRATYAGCYCLGFGVALPACAVAALLRPLNDPLTRGFRDGAAAAAAGVERALTRGRRATATQPALAIPQPTPVPA